MDKRTVAGAAAHAPAVARRRWTRDGPPPTPATARKQAGIFPHKRPSQPVNDPDGLACRRPYARRRQAAMDAVYPLHVLSNERLSGMLCISSASWKVHPNVPLAEYEA